MTKALICLAIACTLAAAEDSQNDWRKPDQLISALDLKRSDVVAVLETKPFVAPRIADRVRTVISFNDSATTANSVDVIVLYDALHLIAQRRELYANLHHLLRPGGRVINVDLSADPPSSGRPEPKLPEPQVVQEFVAAGFHLAQSVSFLPFQYFLVFK